MGVISLQLKKNLKNKIIFDNSHFLAIVTYPE